MNYWIILIIFHSTGCCPGHDAEKFNLFLEHLLKNGMIADGTIATDSIRVKVMNSVQIEDSK